MALGERAGQAVPCTGAARLQTRLEAQADEADVGGKAMG